ncbi:MAG: hypothetical protein Q4P84_08870, partial [Elusimicrobiales bacterium]|nr:hypothetical protein [Elusimicrobiales bacterium]
MMLDVVTNHHGSKFIFMTEQKKNVPLNDLNALMVEGNIDPSEVGILHLPSNLDCVCEDSVVTFRENILDTLYDNKEDPEIYYSMMDYRRSYNRAVELADLQYKGLIEPEFREAEKEFRKTIRRILKKQFKTKAERIEAVNGNGSYGWISKVYPAVNFDEASIVLMTDMKFLLEVDTIVGQTFIIWSENDFRKNRESSKEQNAGKSRLTEHYIIIDEFDVFKQAIITYLTESRDRPLDTIRAFRYILSRLQNWQSLPRLMMTEGEKWKSSSKKFSIEQRFKNLHERAQWIQNKYHLEYFFKQSGVDKTGRYVDPPSTSFMFHDCRQFSVGNAVSIKTDNENRINRIIISNNPSMLCYGFSDLSNDLVGLFDKLAYLVRDLAKNYQDNLINVDGCSPDDEKASLPKCIDSVIDVFDMDRDLSDFIRRMSLHRALKYTRGSQLVDAECTYYSRGFSYDCMEDSSSSQFQTKINLTTYDITPELILRHMCEKTKVIGLSATGGVLSPVCNFSMDYLHDANIRFHRMDEDEESQLRELMDECYEGYRKGKSSVELEGFSFPSYGRTAWESVFGDEDDCAEHMYNLIPCPDKPTECYAQSRYVRAARAVEAFVEHDDVKSMICFFTAMVRGGPDSGFRPEIMDEILNIIEGKYNVRISRCWDKKIDEGNLKGGDIEVVQVDSKNADERLRVVKNHLSE